MPTRITIKKNGPYVVTLGDVELVDHEGNPVPLPEGKPTMSLCRCGASARKPFCDATHSKIGFMAAEQAQREADAGRPPEPPPQSR